MTDQTHCNSCGERLSDDDLNSAGYGPANILLCAWCRKLSDAQLRNGWQPTMQWEDGRDGLRLASLAPIPWRSSNVVILHITHAGEISATHTIDGKRRVLQAAAPDDMVLVAWPGERRQDVFIVDDCQDALRELRPPKRKRW